MLKLLLLLAVVVAIAATEPSAAVNFQDLDDSDVDAFLSDLSDELDVNDNAGSGTANDMSSCDRETPCASSYYVSDEDCKCDACPSSQSSVYSPIKIDGRWPNVGASSCFSCDNGFKMDQGFCVANDQSVTPSPPPPVESSSSSQASPSGTPGASPPASPTPMRLEENLEESTHDGHKVKADSAVQSCSINACCLAGTYGTYPSCTNCPAGKGTGYKPPASPPPLCYCLNTAASHCVSCTACQTLTNGECMPKCTGALSQCSLVATNKGARPAGTCY